MKKKINNLSTSFFVFFENLRFEVKGNELTPKYVFGHLRSTQE